MAWHFSEAESVCVGWLHLLNRSPHGIKAHSLVHFFRAVVLSRRLFFSRLTHTTNTRQLYRMCAPRHTHTHIHTHTHTHTHITDGGTNTAFNNNQHHKTLENVCLKSPERLTPRFYLAALYSQFWTRSVPSPGEATYWRNASWRRPFPQGQQVPAAEGESASNQNGSHMYSWCSQQIYFSVCLCSVCK